MDASALPDIAALLTGSVGPSTRNATCTALAACSSGTGGQSLRESLGSTSSGETILRRLLILCGDPSCVRLALSALVNISEEESTARVMIKFGAVQRATEALLDEEQRGMMSLYCALLSNVTRFKFGIEALIRDVQAIDRLLRIVERVERIPNILWISNACSIKEGREVLLKEGGKQPLNEVFKLMKVEDEAKRFAAASALRNCCMVEDCHQVLIKDTDVVGICLSRLISKRGKIDLERVKNAPREIREAAMDPLRDSEQVVEIRQMLIEAILLLCRSRMGREALRKSVAYDVLEAWTDVEDSEELKQRVENILDRLVAAEDEEESSVQNVQGASTTQDVNR